LRRGCGAGHASDQINEYKRRQAPVGIRVTPRSFGKDWRYPITNKFRA
jgi:NAD+ synthase (glutamine-hydrolysing)